jgi:putative nucleotidyltransferase with HDIG domain
LDPAYLWGLDGGNSVPAGSEFCVLDRQGRLIFGSFGKCGEAWAAFGDDHVAQDEIGIRTAFPVVGEEDGEFIAGRWDLFLGARFFAPDWMIIVSEPRDSVVQPIRRWRVVFPAVVLLAFWVVLLLIIGAIRRNLDPIDRLREATDHLADRDFDFRVDIRSGDEFEELAKAFNQMSSKLRRQFSALAATGKIHRAILSAMETDRVVEEAVVGVLNYFECDRAAIVVVDPDEGGAGRTVVLSGSPEPEYSAAHVVSPHLTASLKQVRPGRVLGHDLPMPGELTDLMKMTGMDTVLAVPITARGKIAAVVGLGFEDRRELPEDELDQLTQLADQFAVAHSNATMLQDVNDFSLGTLEALARAVDAKSPWTAGHSERVTRLAVTIGAAYGLDPHELSKLHRGAMLHDIGKLGISQTLLDKKGRLDHEEFNVVRSHTMIGERILEPVGAFSELMPIVTQHHERFDGSGYPIGLTGSKIDIKARILAVADVYDAMTNPRPYRDSVDPSEVVEMIREQSGRQFDPEVVEAFLTVIDSTGGFIDSATPRRGFSFLIRRGAEHQRARNDGETGSGT